MKKPVPPKPQKFPAAKQRLLDHLLEKNSEGTITPSERLRLEQLVGEAELLMVANAKRLARFSRKESASIPADAVPVIGDGIQAWLRGKESAPDDSACRGVSRRQDCRSTDTTIELDAFSAPHPHPPSKTHSIGTSTRRCAASRDGTPDAKLYCQTARSYGITERMNVLAQLVCSGVRAGIFRVLFGLQSGELHLREIQRQTGFAIGTVRQDLEKLVKLGLVTRRQDGNRVYYTANRCHPVHAEIRQMVLKTVGLADVLTAALKTNSIRCAFVYGSVAAGTTQPESDVDLMVIGNIGLRKVCALLSGVGDRLGREINPHVLSPEEFDQRMREEDHFLTSVLASPKIFIVGSEHDLETMAD